MKKIILISFVLACQIAFSQSHLEALEQNTQIKSYIVNKKMIEMMARMKTDGKDAKSQNYLSLIKKLDQLRVYNTAHSASLAELKKAFLKQVEQNNLQELIRTTHDSKKVKIFANTVNKSDVIKELLMLIESTSGTQENVLMIVQGNFLLEEVVVLTDKLNLPGAEFLND